MKQILKLEEIALFLGGIYLFSLLPYAWWVFPLLLFTPDVSMLGYLVNTKIGAYMYNFVHHRAFALSVIALGIYIESNSLKLVGVILFTHIALDRVMDYGLKYTDSFKHTHLS